MIQIYGQFSNYWSNAGVSRGLACGLADHGLEVQVHDVFGKYDGLWRRLSTGPSVTAGIGLYVGYPVLGWEFLRGHVYKVGAFICESEILPKTWGAIARQCDLVVVPSEWVKRAYVKAGVSALKVVTVPHGLHPVYRQSVPYKVGVAPCKFLHIAGARDFLDRKGTFSLIYAFARVFGDETPAVARLTIRVPFMDMVKNAVALTGREDLFDLDFSDEPLTPEEMWDYYHRGWLAVVQPSRAEAFGIVPCEARSQGIPVIMTATNGQAEHATPWDVLVRTGHPAPIRVNGIPEGRAPDVSVDDIASALRLFWGQRAQRLALAARGVVGYYNAFNWASVTSGLARRLRNVEKETGTGTLNEKYGL